MWQLTVWLIFKYAINIEKYAMLLNIYSFFFFLKSSATESKRMIFQSLVHFPKSTKSGVRSSQNQEIGILSLSPGDRNSVLNHLQPSMHISWKRDQKQKQKWNSIPATLGSATPAPDIYPLYFLGWEEKGNLLCLRKKLALKQLLLFISAVIFHNDNLSHQ